MHKPFAILLVEDHAAIRQVYATEMEEMLQVDVLQAADYGQAVACLHTEPGPDMVIADLEMPGGSGEQLLVYIRNEPRWQTLPVIILTGADAHAKEAELLRLGADDFIEKGGSATVLIARIRAQMRHKLARDRLARLALDRDLFAAGVLQDISSSKGTIASLCQSAKALLRQDPVTSKPEILAVLDKLGTHASRLGSYATEIIQSVRATHQSPHLTPQQIAPLLAWVTEVLTNNCDPQKGSAPVRFQWQVASPLQAVLADKNLLRLALLKIVERALQMAAPGATPCLTISQSVGPMAAGERRELIIHCADDGPPLDTAKASRLFSPRLAATEESGGSEDWALGMTLVESAMRRMGGRAWAEAGPGRGAIIHLALLASGDNPALD